MYCHCFRENSHKVSSSKRTSLLRFDTREVTSYHRIKHVFSRQPVFSVSWSSMFLTYNQRLYFLQLIRNVFWVGIQQFMKKRQKKTVCFHRLC